MAADGVSVVVPHYGYPAPTTALLAALADQRTERPVQVVVVDDASPEPLLRPPDLPGHTTVTDLRVVRRDTNGGFGAAVNTGAALAEHDLLLVLNSDLMVGPGFVEDLCRAAQPWQPAVVGPLVTDPDGAPTWSGRHFPTTAHQAVEWLTPLAGLRGRPALHEAVGHDTRAVPGAVTSVDWLVGAALLLPTAVFREAGGFDEGFFMNAEEVDLQRRLRRRGIPSVFAGTVSVAHVGGGSSDPQRRRAWLVESRFRYAARYGGQRRLRTALAAATAANLVWNVGRRALGRPVRPLATAREELALVRSRPR